MNHVKDDKDDGILMFNYFEDHCDEIMPKLVFAKRTKSMMNETFIMVILRYFPQNMGVFSWITKWIKDKLTDDQKTRVLSMTNSKGENCLHYIARYTDNYYNFQQQKTATILDLFPTKQARSNAILQADNKGITPFMLALILSHDDGDALRLHVANALYQELDNLNDVLRLINSHCSSFDILTIDKKHGLQNENLINRYVYCIKSSMKTHDGYIDSDKLHLSFI